MEGGTLGLHQHHRQRVAHVARPHGPARGEADAQQRLLARQRLGGVGPADGLHGLVADRHGLYVQGSGHALHLGKLRDLLLGHSLRLLGHQLRVGHGGLVDTEQLGGALSRVHLGAEHVVELAARLPVRAQHRFDGFSGALDPREGLVKGFEVGILRRFALVGMDKQCEPSVRPADLLLVGGPARLYLQHLEGAPRLEDAVLLLEALHGVLQEALVHDAVGCFDSLPFGAYLEVACAGEQLPGGAVLEEQHDPHLPDPRDNDPVAEQQRHCGSAAAESVRTFQQLRVQLPEHLLQRVLQLARLPHMDLRGQEGYQLRVEVLRAPVRRLCTAQTLEECECRCWRVCKTQRELQREAGDLGQLVEQDRALQLDALPHRVRTPCSCSDGIFVAAVRRVDLPPLARLGVLHQILPHPASQLGKVYLASQIPQHFIVVSCPTLARRYQLLLLHPGPRARVDQQAFQGALVGVPDLLRRPLLPLEAQRDPLYAGLALQLEGLPEHLAVLDRLGLAVALRPLDRHLPALWLLQ
mmetsp:Transcript_101091/g.286518  ORF Transcript_101091/g.286518 Transcript_101091/m.286518 type:complete len:526 (+) Transcript_101091:652-2229(+)